MVKRYLEFVNESVELILESDVVFSPKFNRLLYKMDHPIAKALLDVENRDFPVRSNYFDIELSKNDTVTFIPDNKAKEIIGDKELVTTTGGALTHNMDQNGALFRELGYVPDAPKAYMPERNNRNTEIGEVMARVTSKVTGNTYAWVKFENGQGVYNITRLIPQTKIADVWVKNRQEIKIGRAVGALLKTANIESFLQKDIETFVNLYKAAIDKLNDIFSFFEVVTGDDIVKWYNYKNYLERKGTMGASCMSDVPGRWLEIYSANPKQVSLVILRSTERDDRIVGRALLWTLDDGKKFMDRIYTMKDSDVETFRDFAKENAWYSKCLNGSTPNGEAFGPKGREKLKLVVHLDKKDYGNYPYLDTLKYFTPGEGLLTNEHTTGSMILETTDGGEDGDGCETCHGEGYIDCYECHGRGDVRCTDCKGKGEVTDKDTSEKKPCKKCGGNGRIRCEECGGDGTVSCPDCG
jgi:hypothetical protein